jgi:hypothetical protein
MPITLNKNNGATILTINNFNNLVIDGNSGSELLPDLVGTEKDAILLRVLGPSMTLSFEYTLVDEASSVVSGTGGTVTMARDQMAYLYSTLMPAGDDGLDDEFTLILEYSTTALDSGTASAGDTLVLRDSSKSWTDNAFTNKVLKLTGGTGSGQVRNITSNTDFILTIDKEWDTTPDNTTTYQIIDGFSRMGNVARITCQMAQDSPLTFRGDCAVPSREHSKVRG